MTFQAPALRIYWTDSLKAAAQAVADETRDDYNNTHDVRHRANYAARFLTVGAVLTDIQVDQITQLRSRLDCRSVEPLISHQLFEAAWSGAWAEADDARAVESRAEVLRTLNEAIAELEACTTDDDVMAWPYHLAVGITAEGKVYAASLAHAATADDVPGVCTNGRGEAAIRTNRQAAIRDHVVALRSSIAMAEARG